MHEHRTIALITGANKGIGRATAEQLTALGMTVLVAARNAGHGEEAAAALRADGRDAYAIKLDVTDPAGVAAAALAFEEGTLAHRFAVAVSQDLPVALPAAG